MFEFLIASIERFRRDSRGSVMLASALAIPAMVFGGGVAVDVSRFYNARAAAQSAADAAALATVHEVALAGSTRQRLTAAASSFARNSLGRLGDNASIEARASSQDATVTVDISIPVPSSFGSLTGLTSKTVSASATARLSGSMKICLLALEPTKNNTVEIVKTARVHAPECSAFVNSTDPKGLSVKDTAKLSARSICTSGGYEGGASNFEPAPRIDCPTIPDPLAARQPPAAAPCTYNNTLVETGIVVLRPGVYCGGIKITNDATARLEPGIYIIRGSKLVVDGKATIEGTDVGFYFDGNAAQFEFDTETTVSLAAPSTGQMAGILFFEDRNASPGSKHKILSNNAHTLLGTIYLPRGLLFIDANRPISERAAYTIIVASQIEMISGPELFLNANYGATTVPVPQGVGPIAGRAQLVR
jgi:Flp pilus assembly protein TadG